MRKKISGDVSNDAPTTTSTSTSSSRENTLIFLPWKEVARLVFFTPRGHSPKFKSNAVFWERSFLHRLETFNFSVIKAWEQFNLNQCIWTCQQQQERIGGTPPCLATPLTWVTWRIWHTKKFPSLPSLSLTLAKVAGARWGEEREWEWEWGSDWPISFYMGKSATVAWTDRRIPGVKFLPMFKVQNGFNSDENKTGKKGIFNRMAPFSS